MLWHELLSPRARPPRLPTCPQCSDTLLAPLMAEHVSSRQVRNHWVCESCGHSFRRSFTVEIADAGD